MHHTLVQPALLISNTGYMLYFIPDLRGLQLAFEFFENGSLGALKMA